ncbi:MAG: STAS/SEC14 domain-containing protein [Desulfobacterales bacterium]
MLEFIDIGMANAVAYRLDGKITEEEMRSVLSLFRDKIDKGEPLLVYQEIVGLEGVEVKAMAEKLKFFRDAGLSHFSKVAVVTHRKWIHKLVDLEDRLFKHIDMRGFPFEEKAGAIDFLKRP